MSRLIIYDFDAGITLLDYSRKIKLLFLYFSGLLHFK